LTQSSNSGNQVGSVFNSTNPTNGSVLYFQYRVGQTTTTTGTTTPFNFESFDLQTGNAAISMTVEGLLGGVVQDTAVLTTTAGHFTTFTEDWNNDDTIEFVSTAGLPGLPLNWGSNTLQMDNVVLGFPATTTTAVPETSTLGDDAAGLCRPRLRRLSKGRGESDGSRRRVICVFIQNLGRPPQESFHRDFRS
jgi:hypothetical protein